MVEALADAGYRPTVYPQVGGCDVVGERVGLGEERVFLGWGGIAIDFNILYISHLWSMGEGCRAQCEQIYYKPLTKL